MAARPTVHAFAIGVPIAKACTVGLAAIQLAFLGSELSVATGIVLSIKMELVGIKREIIIVKDYLEVISIDDVVYSLDLPIIAVTANIFAIYPCDFEIIRNCRSKRRQRDRKEKEGKVHSFLVSMVKKRRMLVFFKSLCC